jgi:cephalosporin-C deacetylase
MPSIDMPLEQLRQYKPATYAEADFDEFWKSTMAEATGQPLNVELIPYALPARGLTCDEIRFDGFGGGRIAGWYLRPAGAGKYPGLCIYHGYGARATRPTNIKKPGSNC